MSGLHGPPTSPLYAEVHAAADTWKAAGACRTPAAIGVNFFPVRGETARPAKDLCAMCPVLEPCREYALAGYERYGIWGGLSERDRRRMRAGGSGITGEARDRLTAPRTPPRIPEAERSAARRARLTEDIEATRVAIGPRRPTGQIAS